MRYECTIVVIPQTEGASTLRPHIEGVAQSLPTRLSDIVVQNELVVSMTGFCDSEGVHSITHGFYHWNETEAGNINSLNCEFGPVDGNATRRCIRHKTWGSHNIEECTSENTYRLQMLRDMEVTAENVGQVTTRISNIVQTNNTEDQSSDNLLIVTNVLTDTVALLGNISVTQNQEVIGYCNFFFFGSLKY